MKQTYNIHLYMLNKIQKKLLPLLLCNLQYIQGGPSSDVNKFFLDSSYLGVSKNTLCMFRDFSLFLSYNFFWDFVMYSASEVSKIHIFLCSRCFAVISFFK